MVAMATHALILRTAERLFATHGIAAVSLRRISASAGQRNTAAAQYHFKDKDSLLREIARSRLATIDARRAALLTAALDGGVTGAEPPRVWPLTEALIRPLAEQAAEPASHYVRFLDRLFAHVGAEVGALAEVGGFHEAFATARVVVDRLPQLAEPQATTRARWAGQLIISGLADLEQAYADAASSPGGRPPLEPSPAADPEAYTVGLIDAVTGLLTAPLTRPTPNAPTTLTAPTAPART